MSPRQLNLGSTAAQTVISGKLTLTLASSSAIERAIGGSGNDILTGNSLKNILNGSAGNDTLNGAAGNDSLLGGAGNDSLNGGTGNDSLVGSLGNDRLGGGTGNDTLIGGAGNDSFTGGSGNDILTGDAGNDRFLYDTGAVFATKAIGIDKITDFIKGEDKIVLDKTTFTGLQSAVGNGFSKGSDFAVVQTDALAATNNALIVYNKTNGNLFYNPNGSASGFGGGGQFADLTNNVLLGATDFILQA